VGTEAVLPGEPAQTAAGAVTTEEGLELTVRAEAEEIVVYPWPLRTAQS